MPRHKRQIYLSVSSGFCWLRLFQKYVIPFPLHFSPSSCCTPLSCSCSSPPFSPSHKMAAHASIQTEDLFVSVPQILLASTVPEVCYNFPYPAPHALSPHSSSTPVPLIPDTPAPHLPLPHTKWRFMPRYKWKIYLSVPPGFCRIRLLKKYVIPSPLILLLMPSPPTPLLPSSHCTPLFCSSPPFSPSHKMAAHASIQTAGLSVPRILQEWIVPEVGYTFPYPALHALHALSSHSTSLPFPIVHSKAKEVQNDFLKLSCISGSRSHDPGQIKCAHGFFSQVANMYMMRRYISDELLYISS